MFVDSEPVTWNICPELIELAIKDRIAKGRKPKVLIVVHLYGMPARINEILEVCREYDIPLIEDAAEALGSRYQDKPVGQYSVIGVR